ncbi:WXG100 family type VII secretion target [Streptomyces coelicoflavus]|uniref:WXG100 family type VII secretion target n=1 Tax=Streptomyces coelicoflavus TaxID=285562 RepID=UPI00368DEB87
MTSKVTYAHVQQVQSEVEGAVLKLQNQLDDTKALISKLAASHEGEQTQSWQTVQNEWGQAVSQLHKTARATTQALSQAADAYQGTERNTGAWS